MSLRWRIALAMAAISVVATAAVGVASYAQTRGRLLVELDRSLTAFDQPIASRQINPRALPDRGPLAGAFVRHVDGDGIVRQSTFPAGFPLTDSARSAAGRARRNVFETIEHDGGRYRVRSIGTRDGIIQVARSLDETDRALQSIRVRMFLLVLVVAAAAAVAGLWIAGRVTRSLRRLTDTAEHIEVTGRLDVHIDDAATDEVGRLGAAFDRMLAALRRSRDQQQRLVQDAGHELRTPLTSLRTNLDTLRRYPDLATDERGEIVADLHAEIEELTLLVNEIVAVGSGAGADETATVFDLAAVVTELAERFARRSGREIVVSAEPGTVEARRTAVQRAVSCLLDNARKFDDSGGPIDVEVGAGRVRVADRGPGIAVDERETVFERFHRAESARSMPGSGLGLSIVREVARRHGGDAFVEDRPGGGAVVGFQLGSQVAGPALPAPPTSSLA